MIPRVGARETSMLAGHCRFAALARMRAMQFKLVEFPFARCGSTGDGRPPLPIVIMQGAAASRPAIEQRCYPKHEGGIP
jgi:hypothetical protein